MPDEPTAPAPDTDDTTAVDGIVRVVEVDAAVDDVWRAVADPAERSLWLDDPDALARQVRVDATTPGRQLEWTWWQPGREGDASTVSVVLTPGDGGGTRVVVTETPLRRALPGASAHAGGTSPARAARRSPSWVHCARDRWDSRLLGLELLFVAARAAVS